MRLIASSFIILSPSNNQIKLPLHSLLDVRSDALYTITIWYMTLLAQWYPTILEPILIDTDSMVESEFLLNCYSVSRYHFEIAVLFFGKLISYDPMW